MRSGVVGRGVVSELYPCFILFSANLPNQPPPTLPDSPALTTLRALYCRRTSIGHLGAPFNPGGKGPPVGSRTSGDLLRDNRSRSEGEREPARENEGEREREREREREEGGLAGRANSPLRNLSCLTSLVSCAITRERCFFRSPYANVSTKPPRFSYLVQRPSCKNARSRRADRRDEFSFLARRSISSLGTNRARQAGLSRVNYRNAPIERAMIHLTRTFFKKRDHYLREAKSHPRDIDTRRES